MLLLLSMSFATAQESAAETPDEAEPPADFIQKGQIVPVSDEDIDEGSDDYTVPEISDDESRRMEEVVRDVGSTPSSSCSRN